MRRTVYRSLDRPSAFFGIRGRFASWLGLGAGASLFLGLLLGLLLDAVVGIAAFAAGAVATYFAVLSLQGRSSDREFSLRMLSRRYPRFWTVPVAPLRRLWRGTAVSLDRRAGAQAGGRDAEPEKY